MGLVRPQFEAIGRDDRRSVELQLLPPLEAGPSTGGAAPRLARPSTAQPAPADNPLAGLGAAPAVVVAAPPVPSPSPSPAASGFPGFFEGGEPGCGLEDIALLTAEERVRCRNQIDAARARRATAAADAERAGRLEAMRRQPHLDGIAPERRAYFDAVAAATRATQEDFRQTALAEVLARRQTFGPKGQNIDANVSARCTLSFGANAAGAAVHCPHAPPAGFLTEEARISPP